MPLLAEHVAQPVHLAFQGVANAGVGTGEGHLGLVGGHVDAHVQASQLGGVELISADFRFWLDIHITRSTTASLQPFCCIATGWPGTVPFTGRLVRPVAPWPESAR